MFPCIIWLEWCKISTLVGIKITSNKGLWKAFVWGAIAEKGLAVDLVEREDGEEREDVLGTRDTLTFH